MGNELASDVCDYVLDDERELNDFLDNHDFTDQERPLIIENASSKYISKEVFELFNKYPTCKNHIYYKAKLLMHLSN